MKILIVDDHGLVREGLRAILGRTELATCYLEAWDAASVMRQVDEHQDLRLVLLDIQLPDCSGFDLLRTLVRRRPALSVIMLSAEYDAATIKQALDLGASGFLPKSTLNQVLVSAIQLVVEGGIYIPPEAFRAAPSDGNPASVGAAGEARAAARVSLDQFGFTARQLDVLERLLQGMSNKQICRELDLAEPTVKIHVRAILRALDVNSRSEAIAKATRLGLVPVGVPAAKPPTGVPQAISRSA